MLGQRHLPNGPWWAALVATLDAGRIRAGVPAHPNLGATPAELLARTTGLDVEYADIKALAGQGLLAVRGRYRGWPLYDGDQLHALPDDETAVDTLRGIIAERQAWLVASMNRQEAASRLGWRVEDLVEAAERREVRSSWRTSAVGPAGSATSRR